MKINQKFLTLLLTVCSIVWSYQTINAQSEEVYTGTAVSFNGPRTQTATFTLRLSGQTSNEEARSFLTTLQEGGQDNLLKAIQKEDLGSFSIGSGLGRTLNVVRESTVDGKRRIFIVFERWLRFAEVRGGYRSVDYPFGVIELFIDNKTGKGEGTYIAAAKIRWDRDEKKNQNQVEIENFATYPVRLMGVQRRNDRKKR